MRVEIIGDKFVVVRGDGNRPQYFSFFVDTDRSSWSKFSGQARNHATRTDAEDTIKRLRSRQQDRRTYASNRS